MFENSYLRFAVLFLAFVLPAACGVARRQLPIVTLPYATYKAADYDSNADVYTFKNIRFAAPPVGNLRFQLPQPPLQQHGVQDGSYGNVCFQAALAGLTGSSSGSLGSLISAGNQSEDCLFLDVYVPGKAMSGQASNLPVIVWIYGGGYVEGSKDGGAAIGLYDGTGPVYASGGNAIVVTFNYRLGPYGWLTGKTAETEAVSNAGLHDQIAVFKWVNKYISLFGGNPQDVSAWGESAGGGSIYYLLTQQGGTQDPLFRRAVVQSPAFSLNIDRFGLMEEQFQSFAEAAGCGGQSLACLVAKDTSVINAASNSSGVVWQPGPDGKYFRQQPTLEFAEGNYWTGIDSLIVSHCIDEPAIFLSAEGINTDAQFTAAIDSMLPQYAINAGVAAQIFAQYPPVNSTNSPYANENERMSAYLSQSSFLTFVRSLTTAYAGKTYNVQFSAFGGTHGSDVLSTWYDPFISLNVSGAEVGFWQVIIPLEYGLPDVGVAKDYQGYLVSHALTGNPNTYSDVFNVPPAIHWPLVGDGTGQYLTNVLNVTDTGFELITDTEDFKSIADFWTNIFKEITELGGYGPY